jgi:hypothetical protein
LDQYSPKNDSSRRSAAPPALATDIDVGIYRVRFVMHELIEILRRNRLLGENRPNTDVISSIELSEANDIINQVEEIVDAGLYRNKKKAFSFSASPDLGGSGFLCRHSECRLKKVLQLSRFAALYADSVFINNFFSGYEYSSDMSLQEETYLRQCLYDDLLVFSEMIPHLLKTVKMLAIYSILGIANYSRIILIT